METLKKYILFLQLGLKRELITWIKIFLKTPEN